MRLVLGPHRDGGLIGEVRQPRGQADVFEAECRAGRDGERAVEIVTGVAGEGGVGIRARRWG